MHGQSDIRMNSLHISALWSMWDLPKHWNWMLTNLSIRKYHNMRDWHKKIHFHWMKNHQTID